MSDSNCAPQKPMPPQGPDSTNAAELSHELKTNVRKTQAMHCTRTPPMEQELIESVLAELSALAVYGSQTMQVWNNIQRLAIKGEKHIREQHINDDFTE